MNRLCATGVLGVAVALCVVPHPVWADAADDQYAVAASHYAAKRWQLAVDEFQKLVDEFPEHDKAGAAAFFQGESLVQLGKLDEARRRFLEFLSKSPNDRYAKQALFRAAEASYLLGDADAAAEQLGRFRAQYAQDKLNSYVLTYLGELALRGDDARKAESLFREALERYPQSRMRHDCRWGLARSAEKQGRNDEAIENYRQLAAQRDSTLADDAALALATLKFSTGKYLEAAKAYEKFAKHHATSPLLPKARLGHGWARFQLAEYDRAQSIFQSLVGADSMVEVEASYWLGLTKKARGDWAGAIATFEPLAARTAKHDLGPAVLFHLADAQLSSGKASDAGRQFAEVISRWPRSDWVDDSLLGQLRVAQTADDHAAIDRLAAEMNERFAASALCRDAQRIRGRSLLIRKDYPRAASMFEALASSVEGGATSLADKHFLALCHQGEGRHAEALVLLETVLKSNDAALVADAQATAAMSLVALERYTEAIPHLEAYLAAAHESHGAANARAQLAVCAAKAGKFPQARQAYAALITKFAKHEVVGPTTQHLAELAYAAGERQWAEELFAALAKMGQSDEATARAISGMAWSQFKNEQHEAAAATFERLLNEFANSAPAAEAARVSGTIFERLDRPTDALAMYQRVIDQYSASKELPAAMLAAARLSAKQGDNQRAAELYARREAEFTDAPEADAALYESAWVLRNLQRMEASDEAFARLRSRFPQSNYWPDATYRLAERAFQASDHQRAETLLDELATRPDAPVREHALYLEAQIAAAGRRWSEVAPPLERMLAEYPETQLKPFAQYWLAETLYQQQNFAEASERFAKLAEAWNERTDTWAARVTLRRAQVLGQQEQWQAAKEIAAAIEGRFPDFEQHYEADYLLGRCLAAEADFEGARKAYDRAIRSQLGAKTETAAMAQWMIGESYFHQKNYDAAMREYLRLEILYAYPQWQSLALLQAGKCAELLEQWQAASELFERLAKTYPDTDAGKEGSRRLRDVKKRASATS